MMLLRQVKTWLFKPTYIEPRPDEIVELTRLGNSHRAEELRQLLENVGISSTVYGAPVTAIAGATEPEGTRVMVLGKDLRAAREVVRDFFDESDQSPP